MKPCHLPALGAALIVWFLHAAQAQAPQASAPLYVVGHIDVLASAKKAGMNLLKQFRESCRNESGTQRCEFAQRLEQQNQFVALEIWKDRAAFEAHRAAAATSQFHDRLRPMLAGPYDERVYAPVSVLPPQPLPGGRLTYAVTHIEVLAARANEAAALLTQMADTGRKATGNVLLEVVRQVDSSNQFSVVSVWTNRRLQDAFDMTAAMRQFRDKLQPMLGAPYDKRLFKVLD